MKFDLSPEIRLEKEDLEKYSRGRFLFFGAAFLLLIFLFLSVFFPSTYFIFSFENPASSKNTLGIPRDKEENPLENNSLLPDSPIFFGAAKTGSYSKARLLVTLSQNSEDLKKSEVLLRKSFQAFFYPEGEPLGFSEGALLNDREKYFIVSRGKLRAFKSLSQLQEMGFSEKAFWPVEEQDLKYNPRGENLDSPAYPEGTVFKVEDSYYFLEDGKLREFVSQKAYLSRFSEEQAVLKDINFLKNYSVPEEELGFADGTLVSYGISAFIVSTGKIYPINNPETFVSSGYAWENLIPISGDEYSLYEKEKLFTISSPHPDGTILETAEGGKYFLIWKHKKFLLPTPKIAQSYFKNAPVKVSEKSLEILEKCELKKSPFSSKKYFCEMPLAGFSSLLGKDYEFQLSSSDEVDLSLLQVTLSKSISFSNFKSAVSEMLGRIKANYANKI